MDELSQQMHAAVVGAQVPPTRIDVDRLIEAEVRRRRHRVWALTGTVVAGAVAAVLVVPAVLAGPGVGGEPVGSAPPLAAPPGSPAPTPSLPSLCAGVTPRPSGPQPPTASYDTVRARPTESPEDGVPRLTAVLRETLRTALPAGVRLEPAAPECTEPKFQYHPSYREYTVSGTLQRGGDSGFLLIRVLPTGTERARGEVCSDAPGELSCVMKEYQDGAMAILRAHEDTPGGQQLSALVSRADGTTLLVVTNNTHHDVAANKATLTADEPLLTLDQLVTIARAPGLTLYP